MGMAPLLAGRQRPPRNEPSRPGPMRRQTRVPIAPPASTCARQRLPGKLKFDVGGFHRWQIEEPRGLAAPGPAQAGQRRRWQLAIPGVAVPPVCDPAIRPPCQPIECGDADEAAVMAKSTRKKWRFPDQGVRPAWHWNHPVSADASLSIVRRRTGQTSYESTAFAVAANRMFRSANDDCHWAARRYRTSDNPRHRAASPQIPHCLQFQYSQNSQFKVFQILSTNKLISTEQF